MIGVQVGAFNRPIYDLLPRSNGPIERRDADSLRFRKYWRPWDDSWEAEEKAKKDLSCRKVFSC